MFHQPFLEHASNKLMIVAHQRAVSENSFFSAIETERVREPQVQICLPKGERHDIRLRLAELLYLGIWFLCINSYTYDSCE